MLPRTEGRSKPMACFGRVAATIMSPPSEGNIEVPLSIGRLPPARPPHATKMPAASAIERAANFLNIRPPGATQAGCSTTLSHRDEESLNRDRIAHRRRDVGQGGVAGRVARRLGEGGARFAPAALMKQDGAERKLSAGVGRGEREGGPKLELGSVVVRQVLFGEREVVVRHGIRRIRV